MDKAHSTGASTLWPLQGYKSTLTLGSIRGFVRAQARFKSTVFELRFELSICIRVYLLIGHPSAQKHNTSYVP